MSLAPSGRCSWYQHAPGVFATIALRRRIGNHAGHAKLSACNMLHRTPEDALLPDTPVLVWTHF